MARDTKLVALLDAAVRALNEAQAEAQRLRPGATLYLESEGGLFAMLPEPEEHKRRDTTTTQRQSLIFARASQRAKCDVGAW